MKFNIGEWMLKPGVKNYNCEQIRQINVSDDNKEVKLFAVAYSDDRRVLDGPAIEITVSSPQENAIRLKAVHFKGVKNNRPSFDINNARISMTVNEDEEKITLSSGKTSLIITKRPASFMYMFDGQVITSVGERFGSPMLGLLDTNDGQFMRARLSVGVGEKIYGLGERFSAFVKNGQTVDIWNEDGGTSSELSYKNIPFYITNRKYGVFVNDTGPVSFEVCTESTTNVQFSVPGQILDFTVIAGKNEKEVLSVYTTLTGKPALPPAWSFGLWLTSSFTTSYDEKIIKNFTNGMKDRDIPLSVFHFDCFWMREGEWCGFEWDDKVFPNPQAMLKDLKDSGLHICVWINPYIGQKSPAFDYAMKNGFLLKRPNGDVWQWDLWQPGLAIIDFTNPDAVKWYQSELKKLLDMGVDAFKTDFGERIPTDCVYYDGSDPLYMHNYYTYLYNKVVFDTLTKVKGENEACLFARSASVGSQKMPVHWGGDNNSNYPSMAESLRGGLSLCLSGFSFWSHDIGGFEGTATPDVYKRWCAFGLLSTHSRLHGSDSYRVPWLFDEEAVDVCRFFTKLKNRLMPYIFSLAVEAHNTGVPAMRAMLLEFDELGVEDCDRQYMLGDALLVAPVMNSEGKGIFYTPSGIWTHLLDNTVIDESGWHEKQFDYFSLPVYVRDNTILPIGSNENTPDYDYTDGITFYIYSLENNRKIIRKIYNSNGNQVLTVSAERTEEKITFEINGEYKDTYICVVDSIGKKSEKIKIQSNKTIIELGK
jgi:alpha-D-xyloside xylohydrolase